MSTGGHIATSFKKYLKPEKKPVKPEPYPSTWRVGGLSKSRSRVMGALKRILIRVMVLISL